MSVNVPLILYLIPFVLAAAVLIRARIRKMRSKSVAENGSVLARDSDVAEEASERSISRSYISYTT